MSGGETTFTQHARRVLNEGKPEEAIDILGSWLRLSPDDAGGWEVVRDAHLELGQSPEAEHAAREVVRLRPESAEAWYRLGVVLGRAGRAEESRQTLHHALSVDPGFEQARTELERLAPSIQQPPETSPEASTRRRRREPPRAVKAEPRESTRVPVKEERDAKPHPRPRPRAQMPSAPPPPERERSADGWKVRSPDGTVHGPYSEDQLAQYLLQGEIGRDWGARFGSGRVTTVREALGPERCDELLRQRMEKQVEEQASRTQQTEVAETSTIRCPHCGQLTVTAEKKSNNNARTAVILLGFLLWPLWLLLLALKDRMHYRCASCGMQWTGDV